MAGFVLFTDMKPSFHFLLSSHGWSSDGLPTIEELPVSQATPEKKSTDKSPSKIQDLLSGDAFPITLKHVTIQTLPLSGWKRELCTIFPPNQHKVWVVCFVCLFVRFCLFFFGGGALLSILHPISHHHNNNIWSVAKVFMKKCYIGPEILNLALP